MICFINVLRIFERADPAHQSRARREFEQPHVVEVVAARELGRHRVEAREGRIKVIFRALKIVKPKSAIVFINSKFNDLIIFAKESCLLMEDLEDDEPNCFDDLLDDVINAILTPPASSVQLIRTWLLEIFSRGIIEIPPPKLKKIEALPAVIDKRQLLLIRGRTGDKNFFRKQKTAAHAFSALELPYLVWGASCLRKDEYENWRDTVKGSFNRPLGTLFLKWAARNRADIISKLRRPTVDLPE